MRLEDLAWDVLGSLVSAAIIGAFLFGLGEVTGVNDRLFDGTCQTFDALNTEQKNDVLTDPAARKAFDRDGDGDLCES